MPVLVNPYIYGVAAPATVTTARGSVVMPTSGGGTVSVVIPGDCKFIQLGGNSMTADGASAGDLRMCVGWATGTSSRRAIAGWDDHAQTTMVTYRKHSDTSCFCMLTTTGGNEGELDVNSWSYNSGTDETTIQFIADTAFGQAYKVRYWAVGGTGVAASLATHTEAASTGDQAYTLPLSGPALVLVMGAEIGADPTGTHASDTTNHLTLHYGATDGTNAWAVCIGATDNIATSDTASYCRGGQCIAMMPSNPNSLDARASVTSLSGTTLTLNWLSRAASRRFFTASFTGVQALVCADVMATGVGTTVSRSTPWKANSGLFVSVDQDESADNTPAATLNFSLGHFANDTTGSNQEGVWSVRSSDNQGTSLCARHQSDDNVVAPVNSGGTSARFQLDQHQADRDATHILYTADTSTGSTIWFGEILLSGVGP